MGEKREILLTDKFTVINRNHLFPIGIGTWGVGGFVERKQDNNDKKQVDALVHMLQNCMNYIEFSVWTAQGHSIELVADAVKQSKVDRKSLFLSQAIYSYTTPTLEAAKNEIEIVLKLFGTDYMDSLSLNEAALSTIGKDVVYTWYKDLLRSKKIRYINLNNPSLGTIKEAKELFGDKLLSAEIGFNFEIRENDENGIIQYANENNILCVIYQPLRRNRTAIHNWPLLVNLAKKYGKTQNQIILNWIVSRGFLPLSKSETLSHIDDHIESLNFTIDTTDLEKLNSFRLPLYTKPQVYWGNVGEGVPIDQLSNIFDDDYAKQMMKYRT